MSTGIGIRDGGTVLAVPWERLRVMYIGTHNTDPESLLSHYLSFECRDKRVCCVRRLGLLVSRVILGANSQSFTVWVFGSHRADGLAAQDWTRLRSAATSQVRSETCSLIVLVSFSHFKGPVMTSVPSGHQSSRFLPPEMAKTIAVASPIGLLSRPAKPAAQYSLYHAQPHCDRAWARTI